MLFNPLNSSRIICNQVTIITVMNKLNKFDEENIISTKKTDQNRD